MSSYTSSGSKTNLLHVLVPILVLVALNMGWVGGVLINRVRRARKIAVTGQQTQADFESSLPSTSISQAHQDVVQPEDKGPEPDAPAAAAVTITPATPKITSGSTLRSMLTSTGCMGKRNTSSSSTSNECMSPPDSTSATPPATAAGSAHGEEECRASWTTSTGGGVIAWTEAVVTHASVATRLPATASAVAVVDEGDFSIETTLSDAVHDSWVEGLGQEEKCEKMQEVSAECEPTALHDAYDGIAVEDYKGLIVLEQCKEVGEVVLEEYAGHSNI